MMILHLYQNFNMKDSVKNAAYFIGAWLILVGIGLLALAI